MDFPAYVTNEKLKTWVQEMVELCKPDNVHWCDGSAAEYDEMFRLMDERDASGPVQWLNAWANDVCHPLQHGASGFAYLPHWYRVDRLTLCGRQREHSAGLWG